MIKKLTSIMLCLTLVSSGGCAGAAIHKPTLPTEAATDIYSPIEAVEVAPLLSVAAPTVETTTGNAPVLIHAGQAFTAPVEGLFFELPVASFILAELENLEARYGVSLTAQRDLDMKRLLLDHETWRLRLNGDRDRFRIIHQADLAEQQRLLNLIQTSMTEGKAFPWMEVFVGIGALFIGVVGGFVAGFFIKS